MNKQINAETKVWRTSQRRPDGGSELNDSGRFGLHIGYLGFGGLNEAKNEQKSCHRRAKSP